MNINIYNEFSNNFLKIINRNDYYKQQLQFIINFKNNILLYTSIGFPIDLYINEIIKKKFNITTIYRTECTWNKQVIYNENQYFFELDLLNPNMPKDYSFITELILHIIKSKNLINDKHFIIIKNIDLLEKYFFAFRILLERFSNNVYFLCTTFKFSKIESPIKSRFTLFRIPLFQHDDIINIFKDLNINLNEHLIKNKTRNIINALFLAQIEKNEPHLITYEFCNYNFPPLYDFIKNKKYDLNDIRLLSYKCCQYNISIKQITFDLFKSTINNNNKKKLIKIACDIDNLLCNTNKGREPIYIECLLCQFLL